MDFTSLLQLKLPTRGGTPPLGVDQLRDAISTNATKLDRAVLYSQGTSMPSSAPLGHEHYREDTGDTWKGTGSAWRFDHATAAATIGAGSVVTPGAPSTLPLGSLSALGPTSLFSLTGNDLVIAVAGTYLINLRVVISADDGNISYGLFEFDPTGVTAVETIASSPVGFSTAVETRPPVTAVASIAAGGRVRVIVSQGSGSAGTIQLAQLHVQRIAP